MVFTPMNTSGQQKLIPMSSPTALEPRTLENLDEPRRLKLTDCLRDASKGDSGALSKVPIVREAVPQGVLISEGRQDHSHELSEWSKIGIVDLMLERE